MTQSVINTLFSTPTSAPAAKQPAQVAGAAAQSFGNVLSRELNGRAAPTRAPVPAKSSNSDAANTKARQQQQRVGERQQAAVSARPGNANIQTTKGAPTARQPAETAKSEKSDATDKPHAVSQEKDDDSPLPNAAAAELLALVGSLTPKAVTAEGATADQTAGDADTADASPLITITASIGADIMPDGIPSETTQAGNAAFEAMLAQAAQSAQASQTAQSSRAAQHVSGTNTSNLQSPRSATEGGQPDFTGALAQASADTSASITKMDLAPGAFAASINASTATDPALLPGVPGAVVVATDALHAAGVTPGEKLAPFVGTSAWEQALGQKVVWMAAGAQQSASLTLNPPDLGPLQVVINVHNSHAEASFIAAQPEVRQALEAALPRLKEMLAEAGISLGQASVNAGTPNHQGGNGQHAAGTDRARGTKAAGIESAEAAPVVRGRRNIGGNGLVDTFA